MPKRITAINCQKTTLPIIKNPNLGEGNFEISWEKSSKDHKEPASVISTLSAPFSRYFICVYTVHVPPAQLPPENVFKVTLLVIKMFYNRSRSPFVSSEFTEKCPACKKGWYAHTDTRTHRALIKRYPHYNSFV